MTTPANVEPTSLNLGTPRATIPDMYVGFSPSFSTHFLSSANIALPYYQDGSPMSPLLHHSNLYDLYRSGNTFSNLSSPIISSPLFKVKKGRHRLSVEEFNARFSGEPMNHTRLTRNVSKLKKTLHYFGTIGRPLYAAPTASSVPCTPIRNNDSFSSESLLYGSAVTPMRLQYRLKQMYKKRPILIQSPLRQSYRAVLRNESHSFDELGRIIVPSLPSKESEADHIADANASHPSNIASEKTNAKHSAEPIDNALELVGSVKDVTLTGSEEVVLDLNGVTILMKEVPHEQLEVTKRKLTYESQSVSTEHFQL